MPFKSEFDDVASIIRETVEKVIEDYYKGFDFNLPEIKIVKL